MILKQEASFCIIGNDDLSHFHHCRLILRDDHISTAPAFYRVASLVIPGILKVERWFDIKQIRKAFRLNAAMDCIRSSPRNRIRKESSSTENRGRKYGIDGLNGVAASVLRSYSYFETTIILTTAEAVLG